MPQNTDDPARAGGMLGKAQDALGALVGMASAKTVDAPGAQSYIASASIGDLYAIAASRAALGRTGSPHIRSFAQLLIEDHGRALEIISAKAALAGHPRSAQTDVDTRRATLLHKLQVAPDAAFDKLFLAQQGAAHQEAAALHKGYAENGDNDILRAWPRARPAP